MHSTPVELISSGFRVKIREYTFFMGGMQNQPGVENIEGKSLAIEARVQKATT